MSALRPLAAAAARRAPLASFNGAAVQRRSFQVSAARPAGKESALHDENRASEIEAKKQDQLKKQKEGKGHWEEGLASDSESVLKADRGEVEASEETIKKLQEETAKVAAKK